jgi:transcription elongation factor GreB
MGDPNYITPGGAKRMQQELAGLRSKERPRVVQEVADAAAQGDRSENAEYIYGKKRLREIDRRIHFLTKRLESAVLVGPESHGRDRVFFGAIVALEDDDGKAVRYQIVGEDETEPNAGRISWKSPIGRALLKRACGDVVVVRRPSGDAELTILSIRYEDDGPATP